MVIDLIFIMLMILAVFKGISKGFIVAVFSLLAFIVGLAAALKLSATVAKHLHDKMNIGGYWLPVLSFALVFIVVAFLIRFVAGVIKKAVSIAFLGWIDSVAGMLLYAIIYLLCFSVILFFSTRIHLITPNVQAASKTYFFIEPLGPKVIGALGKFLPFFNHMFTDLSHFFEEVSKKV
ncbi:CvpA family protein [Segetibacter koreensis]|uniref:CvpA family protein n=1 Tax=Segetibacter koreensis TaxID=398037 RepID=UPI00036D1381|nr:CvpA family protein [Segetibacter koreensis]